MKSTDYVNLTNFENELDLCDTLCTMAEIKKVSVVGNSEFVEYALNLIVDEKYCRFVKIDFDGNDKKNPYIMLLNNSDISILPFADSNNDLFKLSDKIYIDIEAVDSKLMSDCICDNRKTELFTIGADIHVGDTNLEEDNIGKENEKEFTIELDLDTSEIDKKLSAIENRIKNIKDECSSIVADGTCCGEISEIDDKLNSFTISRNNENGYESFTYYSSNNELTYDKISSLLKNLFLNK